MERRQSCGRKGIFFWIDLIFGVAEEGGQEVLIESFVKMANGGFEQRDGA